MREPVVSAFKFERRTVDASRVARIVCAILDEKLVIVLAAVRDGERRDRRVGGQRQPIAEKLRSIV